MASEAKIWPQQLPPVLSHNDIVPEMYVPPPLTNASIAGFVENMPLVHKILQVYQKIPVPPDLEMPCSWSPTGKGHKCATSWMHGLLYTMSREALEFLVENPHMIERVCDNAKPFLLLGSGHEGVVHYSPHKNVSWEPVYRQWKTRAGPCCQCAISKKRGCVRLTCIIPPFTMCSPGAQRLLDELDFIPDVMFNTEISGRLRALLRYGMPRAAENRIMLGPNLSALFDDGYLGLRPLAITRSETRDSQFGTYTKCSVHFSVHWMPEVSIRPNTLVGRDPGREWLDYMLEPDQEYAKYKDMMFETDAVTRGAIPEGYECYLEHGDYQTAENMFVLLAYRWSITMASCLAGSIGIGSDWEDISTEWEEITEYENESEEESSLE